MDKVYKQYETATKAISGYAILYKGEYIGKVVFKRGNCRVTCYAHIHGLTMTRGIANGGGYDMNSASVAQAISKGIKGRTHESWDNRAKEHLDRIGKLDLDGGTHWDNALTKAGYTVLSVV